MTDIESHTRFPHPAACAAACLSLAAIMAPVALGATAVWPRCGLECGIAGAVIAWAQWRRPPLQQAGPAILPFAFGVLQLAPLPTALLLAIAPVSAGAWVLANAGDPAAWGRISVAPNVTLVAWARLFLAVAAVIAVIGLARYDRFRRWFAAALCSSGLVIWGLGLAFPASPTDRILLGVIDLKGPIESWKNPIRPAVQTNGVGYVDWYTAGQNRYQFDAGIIGDGFGPYICSNHFAGAAALTVPFILAWIVLLLRGRAPSVVVMGLVLATIAAAVWTAGALAHSRAGSVSLLLGSIVFLALTASNNWGRRISTACAAACALGIASLAAILYGRIEGVSQLFPPSLQQTVTALTVDSRAMATAAGMRMFAASPVAGTGLGTYSLVFPRVAPGGYLFYFAHNDYAQWLAETGILGVLLAGGVAAWLAYRALRAPRGDSPDGGVFRAAACAAVTGIAAHSLFDWNLHIPANAFLACMAAGLALQAAPTEQTAPARAWRAVGLAGVLGTAILVSGSLGAAVLVARDAMSEATQRQLRAALVAAEMAGRDSSLPSPVASLTAASSRGERMLRWDSGNAQLAILTGQAHEQLADRSADQIAKQRHAALASQRFREAQRHCAMVRGVPEAAPVSKPARGIN